MNTHIELVKKWLADSESVSQKELEVNRIAAYDAAAFAADAAIPDYAAAADAAASAAAYAADAAYWVECYETLKERDDE
jgi:hypothetical protein